MLTVSCESPGALVAHDRPRPTRAAGEVLLRIRRVGVCGTDLHIYTGNQPFLSYPRVMGHELAGIVEEADAGSGLQPGDMAYVMPYLSCGRCIACRKGKPNCCTNIQVLGVHRDGGFAEYLTVPAGFVHKVEGISLDQAAMLEFLAIGAHAVRRADLQAGERVLVTGAGPIGLAVMLFARVGGISWRKGLLTGVALAPMSVFVTLLLEHTRYVGIVLVDELAALAAMTLLLEVLGPVLTQRALIWAHETPAEEEH